MKLCSQCQFTFEDPQQFCDFDGTELTILPEHLPSFKSLSLPATGSASLFLRVARSRVSLAVLAFAGVMLSALLIGYYDSGSQSNIEIASHAESRNDMENLVPQSPSETSGKAKPDQGVKPRIISTQRRIGAGEKPSSMPSPMLRWEPAASRSSLPRPGPSTSKGEATVTSGTGASKPGPEKTNRQSLANNPKSGSRKSNQQAQARNESRPASKDRDTQRSSATAAMVNRRPARQAENSHQQKESKVVSILKKTGSILTKPFKF